MSPHRASGVHLLLCMLCHLLLRMLPMMLLLLLPLPLLLGIGFENAYPLLLFAAEALLQVERRAQPQPFLLELRV